MKEHRPDVRNVGRRILRRSAQGVSTVRRTVARRRNLFTYFAIIGPGVITAAAGNDAGGIATFSTGSLAAGSVHKVVATYDGDANFSASLSAPSVV